jgi:hypothetical protein
MRKGLTLFSVCSTQTESRFPLRVAISFHGGIDPMVYRKGELSKSTIDREWPHQVALAADFVAGANYAIIHTFCRDEHLSLCPRGHNFQRDDTWYVCFCFAERHHAELFQKRFGGEFTDPAHRPKWPRSTRRIDPVAEARNRNGRCTNCHD